MPINLLVAGSPVFGNGKLTSCLSFMASGASSQICYEAQACAARSSASHQLLTLDTGMSLVQADQSIGLNAATYNTRLLDALASAPKLSTQFAGGNAIGKQLQQIAHLLSVKSALGAQRQIFVLRPWVASTRTAINWSFTLDY